MDAIYCYSDNDSSSDEDEGNNNTKIVTKELKQQGKSDKPEKLVESEKSAEFNKSYKGGYHIPSTLSQDQVDPELRAKIDTLFRTREETGRSINSELCKQPVFSNPSFTDKLAAMYQIDQIGSQCDPKHFDPHGALSTDFTTTTATK